MPNYSVIVRSRDDVSWPFEGEPYVLVGGKGTYSRHEYIDPFPAYGHDENVVEAMLDLVTTKFPIKFHTNLYILNNESRGRTNGHMSYDTDYDAKTEEGKRKPFAPYIVLSGKRIPPHPAMTRYLVAHEYGHVIDEWIDYCLSYDEGNKKLRADYKAMRGLDTPPKNYGGSTWHASAGEVLANDFRILVCNVENEFWPHTGIKRPEEVSGLRDWWNEAITKFAYRSEVAAPLATALFKAAEGEKGVPTAQP
jgi:hypothetical protein